MTIRLFTSSRNSQCIQTLNDAQDSISAICMDDTSIITGSFPFSLLICRSVDGSIRTYDIRAGQLHQDSIKSTFFKYFIIRSYLFDCFIAGRSMYCCQYHLQHSGCLRTCIPYVIKRVFLAFVCKVDIKDMFVKN